MSDGTHTPGPWTFVEFDGVYDVCSEVEPGSICTLIGEDRASDAALIAAAPDLLAALKELRGPAGAFMPLANEDSPLRIACAKADEVIARARGASDA